MKAPGSPPQVVLYLAVNVVCLVVLGAPGLAATDTPAYLLWRRSASAAPRVQSR